jgi:crotonobetainyl-CoA:carnitine CoA-transferase CaiB-like acyl-CoA transferase
MQARAAFVEIAGIMQPAPVPRFSRTVPATPAPPPIGNNSAEEALDGWLSAEEIAAWTA